MKENNLLENWSDVNEFKRKKQERKLPYSKKADGNGEAYKRTLICSHSNKPPFSTPQNVFSWGATRLSFVLSKSLFIRPHITNMRFNFPF